MTDMILEILRLYLVRSIVFDSLEDKTVSLAWEAEEEDRDLVDQIAVQVAYVKDGVSDEDLSRARIAGLIVPEVSQAAL